LLGANIPAPSVHILIEPQRSPWSLVFVGTAGDEVSISLDPLTDEADTSTRQLGYVESQSRTTWSTQARAAQTGQLDLSDYNLALTARVLDASLSPLRVGNSPAEIVSTPDAESG